DRLRQLERGSELDPRSIVSADVGETRTGHGPDPRHLEHLAVREVRRRPEPDLRAGIVATEQLDVPELPMCGCGDAAIADRLRRRDRPVQRGRSLLVTALRPVYEGRTEREQ